MPQVQDPVCGMMVDPDDAPATSEWEGKSYFFCSATCK
ncbi:MAG: YHS domain-containing protein, partial [Gemmatimonadota bacterium]